jgi:hypothetical protein
VIGSANVLYAIKVLRSLVASSSQFNFSTFRAKFIWPSPYQENFDLRSNVLLHATVYGCYIFKPTHLLTHQCYFVCVFHALSKNYVLL